MQQIIPINRRPLFAAATRVRKEAELTDKALVYWDVLGNGGKKNMSKRSLGKANDKRRRQVGAFPRTVFGYATHVVPLCSVMSVSRATLSFRTIGTIPSSVRVRPMSVCVGELCKLGLGFAGAYESGSWKYWGTTTYLRQMNKQILRLNPNY